MVLCPARLVAQGNIEIGVGLATLEEGDDRLRGALAFQLGWNKIYASRLYFASREMGPIKDQTLILAGMRRWSIFKSPYLRAEVGPVLMNESYQITYDKESDENFDRQENNFNIGGLVGLSLSLPSNRLLFELAWQSHIFPAGIAGLFLASGRKQDISMILGIKL